MPVPLELWPLRYFVAVAEELNFRRAAERLSITQPPLTRQIQALELLLGTRLFDRDRGGVALTSAGHALLVDARDLLARADALLASVHRRAAPRTPLRLGITTVVDAASFAWLDAAFAQRAPGAQLLVTRQISQRCITDLRRGKLDAALIGLPSLTYELKLLALASDPLVAALPSGHRLRRRRRLALTELGADALFWFPRRLNPAYFDHFEALFRSLGFAPRRLPEPADHHVLLSLIAAGQGVALVPQSLTTIVRAGVVYKPLQEQARLCIGLALAYVDADAHPALRSLLETLADREAA